MKVVLVVAEGILDGLGDLEPPDVEDESEDKEEREEDNPKQGCKEGKVAREVGDVAREKPF